MKKFALSLLVAAVLPGCSENSPVQTADWYKIHEEERLEILSKCKANPGALAVSQDCVNARAAQNRIDFGSKNGVDAKPPIFKK